MMRAFARTALCACVTLTVVSQVHGQSSLDRTRFAALDNQWRAAPANDTVVLTKLADSTSLRGETGARVLLGIVSDSTIDTVRRLYALWGLQAYWGDWLTTCEFLFPYSGPPPNMHVECVGGGGGHTRAFRIPEDPEGRNETVHLDGELRMASIDPALRDTILAALHLVRRQRGSFSEAVADFLDRHARAERWSALVRWECERFRDAWTTTAAMPGRPLRFTYTSTYPPEGCTDTGPPLLARMWRTTGNDTVSLKLLLRGTVYLRDRRLLDALVTTARDARRPPGVRLAAVSAIGAQLHPGVVQPALFASNVPFRNRFLCDMPYPIKGWPQWNGAQPVDAATLARGKAVLQELAASGDSPRLRRDAATVAACVREVDEAIRRATGG